MSKMQYQKKKLILIADKIKHNKKITPEEIFYLLSLEKDAQEKKVFVWVKQVALPLSLAFGFFFTVFPTTFVQVAKEMPSWTNLSPEVLLGVDYLWNIIGEPVEKANILYHIPNIILYSFGVFGIKKLFDALDKRSWFDHVLFAQSVLTEQVKNGKTNLLLKKGHSLLFVGKGDYIGTQLSLNHASGMTVTISEVKPRYTDIWNYYSADTVYEDLKHVIEYSGGENAGEYVFFPVKDDQIFLPAPGAYDVSPHKLDILCQDIRNIEKENKWKEKRIIIVGDRMHRSAVQSEDRDGVIAKTKDVITLESIVHKYSHTTLIDPTDIVLEKIIEIAAGRKIVFRATKDGIQAYKKIFYERLAKLGYHQMRSKKGVLTIGYDIFEDQTEQQMLSRKIDDYYPVVLSKNVRDALIRNGYKKSEFLYVPEIVLSVTSRAADKQ